MNHLIVCNTLYQVFNAINILANDVEIKHGDCDVLLDESFHAFKDSGKIGNWLLDYGLCRYVYYAKTAEQNNLKSKVDTFFYLKKKDHTDEYTFSETKVLDIKYDTVWVGDTNHLGSSLIQRNKNGEVIWYDDGLSSYAKSPRGFGINGLAEKLARLLKFGSYGYRPGKLYVNNAAFAKTKEFMVRQLPAFDNSNSARAMIKKIFDYNEAASCAKKHGYIYLGQAYNSMLGYNGLTNREIMQILADRGTDAVIRKHPRDSDSFQEFAVDNGTNMWELECIDSIKDNHVLIACCSTAQVSPKMLCGSEPYIVFLYKLFLNGNSPLQNVYDGIVDDVIKMYSDRDKIYVPVSVADFEQTVEIINEKRRNQL